MRKSALLRHSLVLAGCLAGVIGMGIVFQGAMDGSAGEVSRGAPLFLIGTWWSGRELGRSMMAGRAAKRVRRDPPV